MFRVAKIDVEGEQKMGLFDWNKTNYLGEMRSFLKDFMMRYIKEYPRSSDTVIPIFSDAEMMIRGWFEREISKMLKKNSVNIECAVLNIVQNVAMHSLKPKAGVDFIKDEDFVFDLYNYVNKVKFVKGYISKQQYEENEELGVKMSLQSPLGMWF